MLYQIATLYSSLCLSSIPSYSHAYPVIHHLDTHVAFHSLAINDAIVNISVLYGTGCVHFSPSIHLEEKVLCPTTILQPSFSITGQPYSVEAELFLFLTGMYKGSSFSRSLPILVVICALIIGIWVGTKQCTCPRYPLGSIRCGRTCAWDGGSPLLM